MPRPRKHRTISIIPRPTIYKPSGVALSRLNQVQLLPEELEALRLADLEGLYQEEAAQRMGISRATFQRILSHAHRQVALALVEGQALNLEGNTISPTDTHPRRRRSRQER